MYKNFVKRLLDMIFASIGLVILSPLFALLAILVRVKLGSPVLFKQERPGRDEKIFILCKFRTMTDKRDSEGELLPDSERLTRFGRLLRATSLDELPELWNVLKGDMALIGPRPLLVEYLPLYSETERRRHEVRPGITGYAQVKGRNSISWEKRFALDIYYVDNISFLLDCKIILMTFRTVIKREGIHSETSDTMEYFTGDKKD